MSELPQTPEPGGDAAGETPADVPAPIDATEASQAATPQRDAPRPDAPRPDAPRPDAPEPAAAPAPASPPLPPPPGPAASAAGTDRPEIAVGAAFAGGLLFAMILKRLAR